MGPSTYGRRALLAATVGTLHLGPSRSRARVFDFSRIVDGHRLSPGEPIEAEADALRA